MSDVPKQITIFEWERNLELLNKLGIKQPWYGGNLSRHIADGDTRLKSLLFDNSLEALNLWNFLLTENERLENAVQNGKKLVGTMKDLGTIPIIVYSTANLIAFYPDGAWWIPCIMEQNSTVLTIADKMGIDESFCPVRAMLGAFIEEGHFPKTDLLISSSGAICDDFSAIAQRLEGLGNPISWWEIPYRRNPNTKETSVELPGGFIAEASQISFVKEELKRIIKIISDTANTKITNEMLSESIAKANQIREVLSQLRLLTFTAKICPLPSLELLIAEMMAIHYCSDRDEVLVVLNNLLSLVKKRVENKIGYFGLNAIKVFWINPVADIRVMNILENCGGRICGTEYLFTHALDAIPVDIEPLEALARMALADPMVGPSTDRAKRICNDIRRFGSEAVVISKIPGASHCALEGSLIANTIRSNFDIPIIKIEVPSISNSFEESIKTKLSALVETVNNNKSKSLKII